VYNNNNNNTGHMFEHGRQELLFSLLNIFLYQSSCCRLPWKREKKIQRRKKKQKVSDPTHCDVKKLEKRRPNVVLFLSQLASKTGLPCREVSSRNWICPPAAEFFQ
jgi:hypothetical protein